MTTPFPNCGLYAITNTQKWPGSNILSAVEGAIEGGAQAIQYRQMQHPTDISTLKKLLTLCTSRQVPLIINDDVALAIDLGADGVHLGKTDTGIADARTQLGDSRIIGATCYNSTELAYKAQNEGATYVAFGSFFPSKTKPGASPADMGILADLKLNIPIVAIGGITPENGGALLDAGVDMLAVIDGVFGRIDPKSAATEYRRLFSARRSSKSYTMSP